MGSGASQHAQFGRYLGRAQHCAVQEHSFPDKIGNLRAVRLVIKTIRVAPLQQRAVPDDADLVRHGKGFKLVMGYQDRRHAVLLEDQAQFPGDLFPQLNIHIGKRFIQQQYVRARRQRSCDCDPLLLSPR